MTLGIELLLAADIRVAAADTRFAQLEIPRGIYPFGGATLRLPRNRLGQRHALAAHRRRIRRHRGAPHRADPGGRRRRCRGAAAGTQIAHTIADGPHRSASRPPWRRRTLPEPGDDAAIDRLRPEVRACSAPPTPLRACNPSSNDATPIPGTLRAATLAHRTAEGARDGPLQEQRAGYRVQPVRGA